MIAAYETRGTTLKKWLSILQYPRKGLMAAALLIATAPGFQAIAKESSTSEEGDQNEDKQDDWTKQLSELTASIQALRDKPNDSLKDGSGAMEATILSSEAMNAAAEAIAADIKLRGISSVVIMSGSSLPDTDAYLALTIEISGLQNLLTAHQSDPQPTRNGGVTVKGALPIAGISEVLGLLSSLLRSETEISDLTGGQLDEAALSVAAANSMLNTGIAVKLSNRILFTDWENDASVSAVVTRLTTLEKLANNIRSVKQPSDEQKAAVARYDNFIVRIQTPTDGKVPLLNALRAAQFINSATALPMLHMKVEKTGGTLLKRKNLATMFGASALAITGGSVISYSLTDKEGTIKAAGLLHCGTTLTNFKKVHQRHKIDGKCNSPKTLATKPGKG